MGEFCAHEDEENQSEELARRLHLLPPVCVDQRSHMQIESPWCVFCFFLLRFPPHSSPFPFSSRVLSFCQRCNSISPLGFCFKKLKNKRGKKKKKKKNTTTMWSPLSNPAAASSASPRSRLWALFSSYRGALSSVPLPVGLPPWPHFVFLFLAATDWAEHRGWWRHTVVITRAISLHSDIAKSLPPRLKLPYKLSMKKWEWRRCTWCWKRKLHRQEREI